MRLDDTILPQGLASEELREACRWLKGTQLRQEVYALDGSGKAEIPYGVSESNATIRPLQPRAGNRHSVLLAQQDAASYQPPLPRNAWYPSKRLSTDQRDGGVPPKRL